MSALAACIHAAALIYGLNPAVIPAIISTEGGRQGMAIRNQNGSTDYGLMQVNSSHVPQLSRLGYTSNVLRYNNCANVMAGTWVYASCLKNTGDLYGAAACYNAGSRPWIAWQSGYVARFAQNMGLPVPSGAAFPTETGMSWPKTAFLSRNSRTPTEQIKLQTAMVFESSGSNLP